MFNVEDRLDEVWVDIEKKQDVKEISDKFSEFSEQIKNVLPEANYGHLNEMDDSFNNMFLLAVEYAYKSGIKDACTKLSEDPKESLLKQIV